VFVFSLALLCVGIGKVSAQSFVGSWTDPIYGGTLYICVDQNENLFALGTEFGALRGKLSDPFTVIAQGITAGEFNRLNDVPSWGLAILTLSEDGNNITWTTYTGNGFYAGGYVSTKVSSSVPLPIQCWSSTAKDDAFEGDWEYTSTSTIWGASICVHPYYYSRFIGSICATDIPCAYHYGICFQNVCTGSWQDVKGGSGISLISPTEDGVLQLSLWTFPLPIGYFPGNLTNTTAHRQVTLTITDDEPSITDCYQYGYLVEAELTAAVGKVCVGLGVLVVSVFTLFH